MTSKRMNRFKEAGLIRCLKDAPCIKCNPKEAHRQREGTLYCPNCVDHDFNFKSSLASQQPNMNAKGPNIKNA